MKLSFDLTSVVLGRHVAVRWLWDVPQPQVNSGQMIAWRTLVEIEITLHDHIFRLTIF